MKRTKMNTEEKGRQHKRARADSGYTFHKVRCAGRICQGWWWQCGLARQWGLYL